MAADRSDYLLQIGYAERIATGGYPAVQQRAPRRRVQFFTSYVDTIIQRDLSASPECTTRRTSEGCSWRSPRPRAH